MPPVKQGGDERGVSYCGDRPNRQFRKPLTMVGDRQRSAISARAPRDSRDKVLLDHLECPWPLHRQRAPYSSAIAFSPFGPRSQRRAEYSESTG